MDLTCKYYDQVLVWPMKYLIIIHILEFLMKLHVRTLNFWIKMFGRFFQISDKFRTK